eukprot:TRINITY_DN3526_c0_g1_i2.p2 TRINITY_DN3526_c0_g1~~TRINITY_DN3526_c0_g1_i2.p2  ORF type:complete len:183 (-),score=11.55 TRINITY_DN3526_c0_g1_i2:606-1154(-)
MQVILTKQEILSSILQFMEVLTQCVVFISKVYPEEIFERSQYVQAVVHRSRSPELNGYINRIVTSLEPWLKTGSLYRYIIQIQKEENETTVDAEKFILELDFVDKTSHTLDIQTLEESFKTFILRLYKGHTPISEGKNKTFRILIHTQENANDTWVSEIQNEVPSNNPDYKLIPLRSANRVT